MSYQHITSTIHTSQRFRFRPIRCIIITTQRSWWGALEAFCLQHRLPFSTKRATPVPFSTDAVVLWFLCCFVLSVLKTMDVEFRNLTFKVDQGIRGYVPFLSGKGKLVIVSNVKSMHDGCLEVMFMFLLNICSMVDR